MLVTILALLANIFALSYRKGEVFSYHFETSSDTSMGRKSESSWKVTMKVDLNATFTVLSVAANGAYMQLTLSDVHVVVESGMKRHTSEKQKNLDELFSAPLYFKMLANGSITDVVSSKSDTSEVVNMKTAVAFALRTNLKADLEADFETATVIDPLGKHTEYSAVSRRGNAITVDTYYSESDFVGFSDRNVREGEVSVESQSTHTLEGDRVIDATATTTLILNKQSGMRFNSEDDEEDMPFAVASTYTLSGYTQLDDTTTENAEFSSLAKFLSQNKGFGMVASLRESYYAGSFSDVDESSEKDASSKCPAVCDLCKAPAGSKSFGFDSCGIFAEAYAVIGVQKGCKAVKRSYIVGAYVTLDVKILGKTINLVDAFAEYGQLNGVAQRNEISLTVFGKSLYDKKLPTLDCKDKSVTPFNSTKTYNPTFKIPLVVLTIEMKATLTYKLKTDVEYKLCPNDYTASVSFKAAGTLTLDGTASAKIPFVASGSATLAGKITDDVDSKAYVEGDTCSAGVVAKNHLEEFDAKLTGTYKALGYEGDEHEIWSKTCEESYYTLIEKEWN